MVQNARMFVGLTSGRSARTGHRGQDDPATAEVAAILLGYLVLGERISAQEIAGALVIGSALLLIDGRVLGLVRRVRADP